MVWLDVVQKYQLISIAERWSTGSSRLFAVGDWDCQNCIQCFKGRRSPTRSSCQMCHHIIEKEWPIWFEILIVGREVILLRSWDFGEGRSITSGFSLSLLSWFHNFWEGDYWGYMFGFRLEQVWNSELTRFYSHRSNTTFRLIYNFGLIDRLA